MKTSKVTSISNKIFIVLSILSVGYVSILSLISPQSTMDLVNVELTNTDAISSIRGIYGGVGIAITISLIFLLFKDNFKGLVFLCVFWGAYAASRIMTIFIDGQLGAFGTQWLTIETVLFTIAGFLLLLNRKQALRNAA